MSPSAEAQQRRNAFSSACAQPKVAGVWRKMNDLTFIHYFSIGVFRSRWNSRRLRRVPPLRGSGDRDIAGYLYLALRAGTARRYISPMISFLRGTVVELLPMRLVMEVAGVGYDVLIPLSTYDKLPQPGQTAKVLTHLQVREDAHVLFGFATAEERDLFHLLVNNVSGVGPKLALAVLNGITPVAFRGAVVAGDLAALSKLKGVGKKTAERIVVELRDKVGVSAAWEAASAAQALSPAEQHVNDAVLALISLGYKQVDAHKAVRALNEKNPTATVEDLVKDALKAM